jgi:hypothetical protein
LLLGVGAALAAIGRSRDDDDGAEMRRLGRRRFVPREEEAAAIAAPATPQETQGYHAFLEVAEGTLTRNKPYAVLDAPTMYGRALGFLAPGVPFSLVGATPLYYHVKIRQVGLTGEFDAWIPKSEVRVASPST